MIYQTPRRPRPNTIGAERVILECLLSTARTSKAITAQTQVTHDLLKKLERLNELLTSHCSGSVSEV
jgi:hypothetical protein